MTEDQQRLAQLEAGNADLVAVNLVTHLARVGVASIAEQINEINRLSARTWRYILTNAGFDGLREVPISDIDAGMKLAVARLSAEWKQQVIEEILPKFVIQRAGGVVFDYWSATEEACLWLRLDSGSAAGNLIDGMIVSAVEDRYGALPDSRLAPELA